MSVIAQTSSALIQAIQRACPENVTVDTHPGQWSQASLRRLIQTPPAVYVAWLGAKASPSPNKALARWACFLVASVLDATPSDPVGIYQLVERISGAIHQHQFEPSGLFTLQTVQNVWSDTQSDIGFAVYAMYFDAITPLTPNRG